MPIARHIVLASKPWKSRLYYVDLSSRNGSFEELEEALQICHRLDDDINSRRLLAYFHLAQCYQRAFIDEGNGPARLYHYLQERNAMSDIQISLKVHQLVYCVSSNSLIGVLILPLMHINLRRISISSDVEIAYLCALFTQQQWTSEELNITEDEAALTEYVVTCLIPAVE